MWDVWFLGQIIYSKIEHPSIINKMPTTIVHYSKQYNVISMSFLMSVLCFICRQRLSNQASRVLSVTKCNKDCFQNINQILKKCKFYAPTFYNLTIRILPHLSGATSSKWIANSCKLGTYLGVPLGKYWHIIKSDIKKISLDRHDLLHLVIKGY